MPRTFVDETLIDDSRPMKQAMPRRAPVIYITPGNHPSATDADVPVRKLAFRVSAGTGEVMLDDEASFLRFPRSQLEHSGVRFENARLMESRGQSMVPTINDGDLLLCAVRRQPEAPDLGLLL